MTEFRKVPFDRIEDLFQPPTEEPPGDPFSPVDVTECYVHGWDEVYRTLQAMLNDEEQR